MSLVPRFQAMPPSTYSLPPLMKKVRVRGVVCVGGQGKQMNRRMRLLAHSTSLYQFNKSTASIVEA